MMQEDEDGIDGNADADKFLVGGYDSGEKGRSLSPKNIYMLTSKNIFSDLTKAIEQNIFSMK